MASDNTDSIVILGHGPGVRFAIDTLRERDLGAEPIGVVTHPYEDQKDDLAMMEKRREMYGSYHYNVFQVPNDYDIALREAADVNDPEVVAWITERRPTYIFSFGCRNIIKKQFRETFEGRVVNFHTTPLPTYRGGANDSWMILNGELGTEQYGCSHYIDVGIDTGDIIAMAPYTLPDRGYPIDVYKKRMDVIPDLVENTLRNLNDPSFAPQPQPMSEATTFPKLFTPRDGKIPFLSWHGKDIERFIYAFGYPYSGAFAYLGQTQVNILRATFDESETYHPFASGLLVGIDEHGTFKVVVPGGVLRIEELECDGQPVAQEQVLRVGKYLT